MLHFHASEVQRPSLHKATQLNGVSAQGLKGHALGARSVEQLLQEFNHIVGKDSESAQSASFQPAARPNGLRAVRESAQGLKGHALGARSVEQLRWLDKPA